LALLISTEKFSDKKSELAMLTAVKSLKITLRIQVFFLKLFFHAKQNGKRDNCKNFMIKKGINKKAST
jgi:hypothetical protein